MQTRDLNWMQNEIDADASHASWMESFPWTRVEGVALPNGKKPSTPRRAEDPQAVRAALEALRP